MNITQLLDRPIGFHRVFVTLTGSVKAAVMLSQALYWQPRASNPDGWWYKTAEDWEEETGLTRHEQDGARKDCAKYLKSELRGAPARLYWKVDEEALSADLLDDNRQSSLPKSGKLVSRKPANSNKKAETTTETTAEIKTGAATAAQLRKHPAIQAFRDKAHLYPAETWLQRIIDAVGDTPEKLEAFGTLVDSWVGRGWNKQNVQGMLEAFRAGGIGTGGRKPSADKLAPETPGLLEWVRKEREAGRI